MGWPVTRVPPPEPPVPPKFFDTGYGEGPNTRYPGGGVVRTNDGGGIGDGDGDADRDDNEYNDDDERR